QPRRVGRDLRLHARAVPDAPARHRHRIGRGLRADRRYPRSARGRAGSHQRRRRRKRLRGGLHAVHRRPGRRCSGRGALRRRDPRQDARTDLGIAMSYEDGMRRLDALESLGIQPGLERITALLARLGDPHRGLRSVVVAGTNGKGSVTAFLAAILAEAGFEPGLYTSPHLSRFEERVRVGDREITRAEFATLAADVMDAVDRMRRDGGLTPTYFEATTALAFLHFKRRRVPIALLEVG